MSLTQFFTHYGELSLGLQPEALAQPEARTVRGRLQAAVGAPAAAARDRLAALAE